MTFYTYLWLREDGTPYYVGKGYRHRAFERHRVGSAPPDERIVLQEWPCEKDAFAAEVFLISYYGRKDKGTGILRNLTDGGEGAAGRDVLRGRRLSPATEIKKGMHLSPSTEFKKGHTSWTGCFGIDSPRFGKRHTDSARQRIAKSLEGRGAGRKLSAETRRRMSEARKRFLKSVK